MRKTYHGGCHCGQIGFTATLDLAAGTIRCNCTYCRKMRVWVARVAEGDFVYVTGGESVAHYKVTPDGAGTFHFCPTCGVRIGTAIARPGRGDRFNVSVGVLDDATEAELIAAPVTWVDGLSGRWAERPGEVRHL